MMIPLIREHQQYIPGKQVLTAENKQTNKPLGIIAQCPAPVTGFWRPNILGPILGPTLLIIMSIPSSALKQEHLFYFCRETLQQLERETDKVD